MAKIHKATCGRCGQPLIFTGWEKGRFAWATTVRIDGVDPHVCVSDDEHGVDWAHEPG